MASRGEGTIEIPLEDFWRYANEYHEHSSAELFYGVPRVNNGNQVIEIDYMYNSGINPTEEFDFEKSKCKLQWDELKNKQHGNKY